MDEKKCLIEKIKDKRVLFIGYKFYYFHEEIIEKMKSLGARVSYYPTRDTSIRFGIVNRLFHNKLELYQQWYYQKLWDEIKDQTFDYFLLIRGMLMPRSFVEKLKAKNPGMISIMYQWDSNVNAPFLNLKPALDTISLFDRIFSFDYKDVADNPNLRYAPTFSMDDIVQLEYDKEEEEFDLFYFGSYLPERYQGMLKMKEFCSEHQLRMKTYFQMKTRYYMIEKYIKQTPLNKSYLHDKPMSKTMYLDLFKKSKAIVDVSNNKQTGISMRVIDAFSTGKKILTTNPWIKEDALYNEDQVYIINMDSISVPSDFWSRPVPVPSKQYTVEHWLYNMFVS